MYLCDAYFKSRAHAVAGDKVYVMYAFAVEKGEELYGFLNAWCTI